jgi:hypothetical protein
MLSNAGTSRSNVLLAKLGALFQIATDIAHHSSPLRECAGKEKPAVFGEAAGFLTTATSEGSQATLKLNVTIG